jgi:hypothetical protein
MAKRIEKIAFPPESQLNSRLGEASYQSAFETELRTAGLTPAQIAARELARTPGWLDGLVILRNRLVAPFGLKAVGRLSLALDEDALARLAPGDPFSIFRVAFIDAAELVLGIDDSHLDVRISYLVRRNGGTASYVVASWVKTHNGLGRLYMLPVAPIHGLLVRLAMRAASV